MTQPETPAPPRRRIVVVTGLSGAGKSSILHTLEDLGYQTVDNLPLALLGNVAGADCAPLAVGIDARARDFNAADLQAWLEKLRADYAADAELIFATASRAVLLRRYTETRRRHPLAQEGRVVDGIEAEAALLHSLRERADLLVDTSDLPSPALRQMIEARYRLGGASSGLAVNLVSFAFPAGLPRDADLVFDVRFLRNPHYRADLRALTGLHPDIGAYIQTDPDFSRFFDKLTDLLHFLLPRFVQEGKRYVTVAVGCTGGLHRSVFVVECLAPRMARSGWRITRTHRELAAGNRARPASGPQPALPGPAASPGAR
jgi:UPF0042 nucleotide-binding protein